jgi:hypothetical protein
MQINILAALFRAIERNPYRLTLFAFNLAGQVR